MLPATAGLAAAVVIFVVLMGFWRRCRRTIPMFP